MKRLFKGKKAIVTIPIALVLSLLFFPFAIGGGLGYFSFKKIGSNKVKFATLVIIGFFTLFIGSAWIIGIVSPPPTSTPAQETSKTPKVPTEKIVKSSGTSKTKIVTPTPIVKPSSPTVEILKNSVQKKGVEAKVVKVVDGDTLSVSLNGKNETVRIIGINTPETVDPRKPVQCFGKQASDRAKSLLSGQTIQLESDPTQGDKDKYQRLLRYVWLNNGAADFGKQMIADGYAYEYTYDTPYKYQSDYKKAQADAMNSNKGLWADNTCGGKLSSSDMSSTSKSTKTTKTSSQPQTNASDNTNSSCSGPDLDCSDFKTHIEAQSFFNSCGFSAENDPMNLDSVGVGDGIACESLK